MEHFFLRWCLYKTEWNGQCFSWCVLNECSGIKWHINKDDLFLIYQPQLQIIFTCIALSLPNLQLFGPRQFINGSIFHVYRYTKSLLWFT